MIVLRAFRNTYLQLACEELQNAKCKMLGSYSHFALFIYQFNFCNSFPPAQHLSLARAGVDSCQGPKLLTAYASAAACLCSINRWL